MALMAMADWQSAASAFCHGLKLDPGSEVMVSTLAVAASMAEETDWPRSACLGVSAVQQVK